MSRGILAAALAVASADAMVGSYCGVPPTSCAAVRCASYQCPNDEYHSYGCTGQCWTGEADGSCQHWKPLCTCPSEPDCNACPPRVRRAWSSLACNERALYIEAVKEFKATHSAEYDGFVGMHVTAWDYAHGTSAFLPWHRYYLLGWENALRSLGGQFACITVPYWDWERDAGAEATSSVLRANTFGTADGIDGSGCVTNGVASFPGWAVTDGTCLRRANGQSGWWGFTDEASMAALIIGDSSFNAFRPALEGNPHVAPHVWIGSPGGHMGSSPSPEDPLFFVHHANVDRMWALWQDYHGHDTAAAAAHYSAHKDPGNPTLLTTLQLTSVMPMWLPGGGGTTLPYFSAPYRVMDMLRLNTIPDGNEYTYGPDNLAFAMGSPASGVWNWVVPSETEPFECPQFAVPTDLLAVPLPRPDRCGRFDHIRRLTMRTVPTRYAALYEMAEAQCGNEGRGWSVPKWFWQWTKRHGFTWNIRRFFPCGTLPPRTTLKPERPDYGRYPRWEYGMPVLHPPKWPVEYEPLPPRTPTPDEYPHVPPYGPRTPSPNGGCVDLTMPSGEPWQATYGSARITCAQITHRRFCHEFPHYVGGVMSASDACCICGGGDGGSYPVRTPVPDDYPVRTRAPRTATPDDYPVRTRAPRTETPDDYPVRTLTPRTATPDDYPVRTRAPRTETPDDYPVRTRAPKTETPDDYPVRTRAPRTETPDDYPVRTRAPRTETPDDYPVRTRAPKTETPDDYPVRTRAPKTETPDDYPVRTLTPRTATPDDYPVRTRAPKTETPDDYPVRTRAPKTETPDDYPVRTLTPRTATPDDYPVRTLTPRTETPDDYPVRTRAPKTETPDDYPVRTLTPRTATPDDYPVRTRAPKTETPDDYPVRTRAPKTETPDDYPVRTRAPKTETPDDYPVRTRAPKTETPDDYPVRTLTPRTATPDDYPVRTRAPKTETPDDYPVRTRAPKTETPDDYPVRTRAPKTETPDDYPVRTRAPTPPLDDVIITRECVDHAGPNGEPWKSDDGVTCADFKSSDSCAKYSTALKVCCVCGGGQRAP